MADGPKLPPSAKKFLPAGRAEVLGPGQRQQRLRDQLAQIPKTLDHNQQVARGAMHHELRVKAQQRIKKQLFTAAVGSLAQVKEFCTEIQQNYEHAELSVPKLKGEARAAEKVTWDYGSFTGGPGKRTAVRGDWYGIKDVARLTIVMRSDADCLAALNEIRAKFAPQHGRSVIVEKIVDPNDLKNNPGGYSGYTAFVRTSNGWPAEIQINISTIIYAKEGAGVAKAVLGDTEFNRIQTLYGLPCGFGHALYEISRKPSAGPLAAVAAEASRVYYAYFRGAQPDLSKKQWLLAKIQELGLDHH